MYSDNLKECKLCIYGLEMDTVSIIKSTSDIIEGNQVH